MSIEQTGVIDVIDTDERTGTVILTISDPLNWTTGEEEHLLLLQEKLNTYLSFIESRDIETVYPRAVDSSIAIHITYKYAPSDQALSFYAFAAKALKDAGFRLSHGFLEHR